MGIVIILYSIACDLYMEIQARTFFMETLTVFALISWNPASLCPQIIPPHLLSHSLPIY